jgi:hypothetical protein
LGIWFLSMHERILHPTTDRAPAVQNPCRFFTFNATLFKNKKHFKTQLKVTLFAVVTVSSVAKQ